MATYQLKKLYKQLSQTKPTRRFEDAKIDLSTPSKYNIEILYTLILEYYLQNGGNKTQLQSKIPYKGSKANRNGGVIFRDKNIPSKLLDIITNFLDLIRSRQVDSDQKVSVNP